MNCPVCNITLVMTERQGVEIDHCPQCRGVWLDRGELDKIIERSNAFLRDDAGGVGGGGDRAAGVGYGQPDRDRRRDDDDRRRYDRDDDRGHGHYHKRRKSFWEELFD
jgi:uncharacterized protein